MAEDDPEAHMLCNNRKGKRKKKTSMVTPFARDKLSILEKTSSDVGPLVFGSSFTQALQRGIY